MYRIGWENYLPHPSGPGPGLGLGLGLAPGGGGVLLSWSFLPPVASSRHTGWPLEFSQVFVFAFS